MIRVKKTFEIVTSAEVMKRIERFLALLHHNSNFGHSGLFAMALDGDGCEKVTITPQPGFGREVDAIGGVGGDVEIAHNDSFSCRKIEKTNHFYHTETIAGLYRDDELIKTIPSTNNIEGLRAKIGEK